MIDKEKAKEIVRRALQIANLMDEICRIADDHETSQLLCEAYPFDGSLDEVFCEVIHWRDTMADKAKVPLCP